MSVFNDSVYSEFYTEAAKKVLLTAESFAAELNSVSIGTEHLLYGLCSYPDTSAGKLLSDNGIHAEDVRAFVQSMSDLGNGRIQEEN